MSTLAPTTPRHACPLEARVRAQLRAGDGRGAAATAIEALGPQVFRYLCSLLREEDDAHDAFSCWAEHLWHGLPGFRFEASLRAWSFRLAWNAAQNLRNEAWRRNCDRLRSGAASRLAASIRSREAGLEAQQQALDELRAALDDEDRSLLALRLDQGLSWGEISEVLSWEGAPVGPGALMKRFERLKARLGRLARERGLLPQEP